MKTEKIKLLIITQKVDRNDPILGFFRAWIDEFVLRCERLFVIGLSVAPEETNNRLEKINFFSLGKEEGIGKMGRLIRFFSYIWDRHRKYDAVFVHMNPIYVVLAGWYWKWWRRVPVVLWYVHRTVDWKLRIASLFVDAIFTTSKEGCRIAEKKRQVVMHGIDTVLFQTYKKTKSLSRQGEVSLVHVGRITPIKNCDTIIDAIPFLEKKVSRPVRLTFIGEPVTRDDHEYYAALRERVRAQHLDQKVFFEDAIAHHVLPQRLTSFDVMVNATPTGGTDKVVFEAMVMQLPVVVSNRAFDIFLGPRWQELCIFKERDAIDLATRIAGLLSQLDQEQCLMLKEFSSVASQYSVAMPVAHIVDFLEKKQ